MKEKNQTDRASHPSPRWVLELQPAGAEAIVEHGGKDITVLFQKLHPRGTLEHVLNASHVVGETDEAFPPALAEVEDDEDELEEKRAKLPPVGTVVALSEFEAMAKLVLGENSRAWNYIFSYSDDGASGSWQAEFSDTDNAKSRPSTLTQS